MSIVSAEDWDELIDFVRLYMKIYMHTIHPPKILEEAEVMQAAGKLSEKYGI